LRYRVFVSYDNGVTAQACNCAKLQKENAKLQAENARLKEDVAQLRGELENAVVVVELQKADM
jgi:cell division protein FtsB